MTQRTWIIIAVVVIIVIALIWWMSGDDAEVEGPAGEAPLEEEAPATQ